MSRGVASACPGASIDCVPMADGGEGTVDALVAATGGSSTRPRSAAREANRSPPDSAC